MTKILKKLGLGAATLGLVVAGAAAFSAFEAHVINVTARIENALKVSTNAIDFGTVFPQEHLNKPLNVALSQSFMDEGRVDDVEYFIRQKPKCGITSQDGTVLDHQSTQTGHVVPTLDDPSTQQDESNGGTAYTVDCGRPSRPLDEAGGETYGVLPSLCEYISKEEDLKPDNDSSLASFHKPFVVQNGQIVWNDTPGRLAKSEQDISDDWTIDLAVPCFGGYCAQDWASFVLGINPKANPSDYTQPIGNEHKVFGCDLWVEVSGVSEKPTTGTLNVQKVLINNDDTGSFFTPDAFSFTVNGGSPVAFEADGSNAFAGVPAGAHVVAEVPASGYTTTYSGDCDANGNVVVPAGGSATCVVTNDDIPVPVPT